ncbi:hypothetical protein [Pseudomonas oryzihabitans]|uniref:hypothetical protein n=1 Tax=Pseudomonas oryzihabitans TaxID=47885 RepID=UPI00214E0EF1|nr:hypothetical protein [Pseudomonas psychrotolerans]UUW74202.1 hypothetical protein NRG74_22925 [Pseudomonas psychrotolerans]
MDIRYDDFVELLEHLAHAPEKDLPPMTVTSVIKKVRGTGNPRLHYARGHVTVTFQTQYGPLQIGEAWVAYPGPDNDTTDWEVFMAVELHEQTWSFGTTRIVDEHGLPKPVDAGELCIELMDAISWVGWEPYVEATLPAREASWNAVKDQYPDIRVDPWGAGWGKPGRKGRKGRKSRSGKGRSGRKSGTARRGGR